MNGAKPKLTLEQVAFIRAAHARRQQIVAELARYPTHQDLADSLGVSVTTVRNALHHRHTKHHREAARAANNVPRGTSTNNQGAQP